MLAAALVSACTLPGMGGDPIDSGIVVEPDSAAPEVAGDELTTTTWVEASARAVVTGGSLDVYDAPGGNPAVTLNPTTVFGTTRVLLVEEQRDGWVKVRIPIRPNHRAGWVPVERVEVEDLDLDVDIDLSTRVLSVRQGDQAVLSTEVAIGTSENPTPIGTFFVTDKLETPDAGGSYGPYAFGLSGYSETLTEFAGGDGQIGIHGTNDPDSIGQDVSHGCIRVPNEIAVQLADLLPLGTPVHIA